MTPFIPSPHLAAAPIRARKNGSSQGFFLSLTQNAPQAKYKQH